MKKTSGVVFILRMGGKLANINGKALAIYQIIHDSGYHLVTREKKDNSCEICEMCGAKSDMMMHREYRRYIHEWNKTVIDDGYIEWLDVCGNRTRIFIEIKIQSCGGSVSDKLFKYLVYNACEMYPGIFILTTNDDNTFWTPSLRFLEKYKMNKTGNENIIFVWQSGLSVLLSTLQKCQINKMSLSDTLDVITKQILAL